MAQRKRNAGKIRDLETQVDSLETAVDTIEANLGNPVVDQAKMRGTISLSSGVPSLDEQDNIVLLTDTGAGRATLTIGQDFVTATGGASSDWTSLVSTQSGAVSVTPNYGSKTAGSIQVQAINFLTDTFADPAEYSVVGFGIQ